MKTLRELFSFGKEAVSYPQFFAEITAKNFERMLLVLWADAVLRAVFIGLYASGIYALNQLYWQVNAFALAVYACILLSVYGVRSSMSTATQQRFICAMIVFGNITGSSLSYSGYETYFSVNAMLVASYLWVSPLIIGGWRTATILTGIHVCFIGAIVVKVGWATQTYNNLIVLCVSNIILSFLSQTRLHYLYREFIDRQTIHQQNIEIESINEELLRSHKYLIDANDSLRALSEEKTAMMSLVAHDLRNPLAGMMLSAELLEAHLHKLHDAKSDAHSEKSMNLLQKIQTQGERVNDIVNDILDIHRTETITLELYPVNIIDVCTTMIQANRIHADTKGIALQLHVASEMPYSDLYCRADRRMCEQVMDNLLSNAIKFSPMNTTVTVSVHERHDAHTEMITVDVIDQGQGFMPQDFENLFTPFRPLSATPTNGESSQGVGLALSKRMAEKMHGTLTANNRVQGGAVLSFALDKAPLHQVFHAHHGEHI
jgi:two-component system, sensor histidine kinase LadS